MAVLLNFKICDNAKECGGVAVCPTGALSWNEERNTIEIDNSKCISCGACEKECPIGAIVVAKSDEEYKKLNKEIEEDPRTTKDLFVDRYGAVAISEFFKIDVKDIKDKVSSNSLTLIEIYNPDEAECLLKSIPIKEITKKFPSDTLFYKTESSEIIGEYGIKELPSLLVFKKGKILGHIDGYYDQQAKSDFIKKIESFIK